MIHLPHWGKAAIIEASSGRSTVVNIKLTPEQEKIVQDELKSGHFRSIEQVIGEALRALHEKEQPSSAVSRGAQGDAVREMLAFVERNCVRLEGLSVKELIREGHRL